SGKTLLAKTLARLVNVPIVIADATCVAQAGYVCADSKGGVASMATATW
ncbi:hypothetical protein Gpo141_00011119, partial [Globisporangium polare]